ncbi:phosphatidate cytidylyltransferase [Litorihabitans aurantiacus]|uniref:Phosphatidate cytidylyltransferase n=1 Tax=Litorihabitans aurantiacus TaxID=1930061 RepID=A0AA38CP85_9MICO|nr:phosphatidate cytidylyltransferase [Litorihabitans aurantiacus]
MATPGDDGAPSDPPLTRRELRARREAAERAAAERDGGAGVPQDASDGAGPSGTTAPGTSTPRPAAPASAAPPVTPVIEAAPAIPPAPASLVAELERPRADEAPANEQRESGASGAGAAPSEVDLTAPLAPEPTPADVLTADVGRTSRAGRNVPVAAGVGVALVLALVASLFWRKEAFGILAFAAVLGALVELRAALARQQIILPVLPIAVGAVGMFVSAYLAGTEALLVAFVLTAGGVVVWCALDGGGLRVLRNATAAIFVAAYVPFLASFLALALAADDGEWRVLAVVVLVVAGDTGGWAAGVLIGRHPLAPTISPKKSWEGLGGSVVLAVAIGTVGLPLVLDVTWWQGALVGLLAVIAGLVGDLGESLIKRDLGMKDMGDSIPGHGGILDRVDALLVAAPVVVTALAVAAPIA